MIWGGFPGGSLLPVKCLLDAVAHGLLIGKHNRSRSLLEEPISQYFALVQQRHRAVKVLADGNGDTAQTIAFAVAL